MHKVFIQTVLATAVFFILNSTAFSQENNTLKSILKNKQIRVGVINGPFFHQLTPAGNTGFDYELALGFANYLGVDLVLKHFYSDTALASALSQKEIDVAAPGLPILTPPIFSSGPVLNRSSWMYIYPKTHPGRCDMRDEQERIVLESIQSFAAKITGVPWQARPASDVDSILSEISATQSGCTILPRSWFERVKPLYSDLTAVEIEPTRLERVWWVNKPQSDLLSSLFEFIHLSRVNQSLDILISREQQAFHRISPIDSRLLLQHIEANLSKLKPTFIDNSRDVNWTLLAAIDYVETQWQLSADTANQVSPSTLLAQRLITINQRLSKLSEQMPARIAEPDKTWMLIAAYYLGIEQLEQGRQLTMQADANPDLWIDVKQQLPRLTQPVVYSQTAQGYAPGDQAVSFVEQVRYVSDTLSLVEK